MDSAVRVFCEDGQRQRMRAGLSPQILDVPRQPFHLCHCHVNLLFSACAHICLCIFFSVSLSPYICIFHFTCRSSEGTMINSKDLTQEGSTRCVVVISKFQINWEHLEFGNILQVLHSFLWMFQPQAVCAFGLIIIFFTYNKLCYICLIYCMLLFENVNHLCCIVDE